MSDNRSLDEFARDDPSSGDEPATDGDERDDQGAAGSETESGKDGTEPAERVVEPMAETFAWSATGGRCADCGERVEERWRDADGLVCADCKAW